MPRRLSHLFLAHSRRSARPLLGDPAYRVGAAWRAAIAGWHALLPGLLKVAIPHDATADWDEPAPQLVAALTIDASDIGDCLRRHADTVAGFGVARRIRTLAWIAIRMRLRSTVIRQPSKMPTSMALSPVTVMMKVAGAFWIRARDR